MSKPDIIEKLLSGVNLVSLGLLLIFVIFSLLVALYQLSLIGVLSSSVSAVCIWYLMSILHNYTFLEKRHSK